MQRRNIILISILLLVTHYAQSSVDYEHTALKQSLSKVGLLSDDKREMVSITDSLSLKMPINGDFFRTDVTNKKNIKYIYIGRINSCRSGGCCALNTLKGNNNYEYFDYYILFDSTATTIQVGVFNYQASHGHEVTSKGWLKQFINYDGSSPLKVNKDIDAIAGATISTHAIIDDVNDKVSLLKSYLE